MRGGGADAPFFHCIFRCDHGACVCRKMADPPHCFWKNRAGRYGKLQYIPDDRNFINSVSCHLQFRRCHVQGNGGFQNSNENVACDEWAEPCRKCRTSVRAWNGRGRSCHSHCSVAYAGRRVDAFLHEGQHKGSSCAHDSGPSL